MFIATMSDGKLLAEGRDVEHFDALPNGITSMQLTLPHTIFKQVADKTLTRQSAIAIGRYDYYYCAKQAIANVMSIQGSAGQMMRGGQGKITHEVLAGIDLKRNEVVYIKVNVETGDVTVDKFNYPWWLRTYNINSDTFKKGVSQLEPQTN